MLDERAIDDLRNGFAGGVLAPGDAGYEEARTLYNAMIDRRPGAIAQCAGVEDVIRAVTFAREREIPTAVRSGGHSVAGHSTNDGGLVIDVRPMKEVTIDPEARTARVGAGCTWADFDGPAQEHGLATTGGRVSTTGVAGLTLGGGSGWLERKHGLACDSLHAVELVTADGTALRASASENADLFWALHGGGGNFGVATALEFDLHEVGPEVLAGLMLWPAQRGREVMTALREIADGGPDELGIGAIYLTGPPEEFVPAELQGSLCVAIAGMYAGPVEEGEPHFARFRELAPAVDLVAPMPYAEFQRFIDDPPGFRNWWTADYLDTLPDAAIEAFAAGSERMPVGEAAQSILVPWGGAVARNGRDWPMANRDATWVTHPFVLWMDAARDEEHIAWGRSMSAAMKEFATGGIYLNFIGDEGEERVRAAFGDAYDRLAAIKARYDPDNLFRGNQNIKPRAAAPV